jgi:3-hydroxybutyryl-CoA dehydrogenase
MMNAPVGVVGSGVIGASVAHAVAQSGLDVIAVDNDRVALETAAVSIARAVRVHHLVSESASRVDASEVLDRITFTKDMGALEPCDLVIENVTEQWDAKSRVYPVLEESCKGTTIFAANTSCFPVTRLGSLLRDPSRLVGLHFMNPVPLSRAAELVRGRLSSEAAIDAVRSLVESLGKSAITVADGPGFISNRVLMPMINEAIFAFQDGLGDAETVDRVFVECFGHKMGPLATADLIGLDTILRSIQVLEEEFGDSKYRPAPLLRRMVEAGELGRKSGSGFFEYARRSHPPANRSEGGTS